jgi:histidine ammonia-lyase
MHRRTVGLSGAEEHPLGVVMYGLNTGVGWTTEVYMKRQFIWCWSEILGASLYDFNEGVRWTAGQGVRSSDAE